MREVRNVAEVMRETMRQLKADSVAAVGEFQKEVSVSQEQMGKVRALTSELKEANQEVSAMLGESGSNFSTKVPASENSGVTTKPDINGVTVNK